MQLYLWTVSIAEEKKSAGDMSRDWGGLEDGNSDLSIYKKRMEVETNLVIVN